MTVLSSTERPLSALDAIFTRRSIRQFASTPIDRFAVQSLLDAAVQAPTAVHAEPWAFVVIQDMTILKRISDRAKSLWASEAAGMFRRLHADSNPATSAFAERMASPDFSIFYNANTLIAIGARRLGPFVAADCWLAAENLMIAACAIGLGTCCIGSAVPALNAPETRSELGIVADVEIIAPIIVGVPDGSVAEAVRKEPQILVWK